MISHKHKFIFIHIPKCGGTSIEKFFNSKISDYRKHDTLGMILNQNVETENYFKFSIVRNPFDVTVSMYNYLWNSEYKWPVLWRKKNKEFARLNFKQWVTHRYFKTPTIHSVSVAKDGGSNPSFLSFFSTKSKRFDMDFIGRFENLQEDFNIICNKIGIPQQQLPHENATNHKHYTEYYDDETKSIVSEKYAKDIEYFGYEFGE